MILHTAHGKFTVAILAGLLIARTCAFALNPKLDVSQYAHTSWKIREGFAKGSIIAITQTPDGYLWLGTAFGLYRFDGVRQVRWQPPQRQKLPSETITKLIVARDGTLWIGTWSGLASWKDGSLTQYAELAGSAIFALTEDRKASIWVGTKGPGGKLCEIRNGAVRCSQEMNGVDRGVFGLHEDSKGNLWVGLEAGVWRWRPGPPEFYPVAGLPNGRMQGMADSEDGTILIASTGAVMRLVNGKAEAVDRFPTARPGFRVLKMLRDREGGLWLCPAGRGIVHIHQGRTDVFSETDGLSGNDIYDLFEDHEGNIWAGTINGLDRFHEIPVVTYSRKQGLSDIPWGGMLGGSDGSIWFAALDGLYRLSDGQITVYRQRRAAGGSKQQIIGSGLPDEGVGALFQDSRGLIWASTLTGIGYLENDRFVLTAAPGGLVSSIIGDGSGNLWIANRELGLLRMSRGNVFPPLPWTTFGHKDPAVVLAPDPIRGGLWLGFSRGGAVWFRDGHVHSSFSAADGLGAGPVNQLQFDSEGALWIATDGGLSRLKDDQIATLTSKNGLPCDAVQWTKEDDTQSVWLMMPCGLVKVTRSQLDTWASVGDKSSSTIHPTVFDNSDGLRTLAVIGDYRPQVDRSADGRIWFMSPDGISVVDPHRLPINKAPPPVHIEKVVSNNKEYWKNLSGDVQSNPRLPPLVRELEIDYTALSLVAPEKVLFRYKLEGWDQDWQDAGTRRQAFYNNLPPRNYTFRVKACNNTGLWNDTGAALDFSVAPAYYQTYWFRLLCFAAFIVLLWALYRWRIHQLKAQEMRMRDVVETIPAMTFTTSCEGSNTFVNKGWTDYTGLSAGETSGAGWQRAIHPDDLERNSEKWSISVATGHCFEDEARFRRATDGEYRWFLVRGVPLRDPHGNIVRWYGTLTDIEDRKRAEQALQRSEDYLSEAQRLSHTGSWAWSPATDNTYYSEECYRVLGFTPRDGVPPPLETIIQRIHPDDQARCREQVEKGIRDKVDFYLDYRIVHPDQSVREIHCVSHPVLDRFGDLVELVGTVIDITERKRAEEALQRSQFYINEGQRLAHMGSWAFNPLGFFDYWSDELFQIYGLDPKKGAPTLEQYLATLHPQDRDSMAETIKAMHLECCGCDVKKRIVRPDGQLRYVRCVGIPVIKDEVLKGFLGSAIDITEQELLMRELERREAYLAESQRLNRTGTLASDPTTMMPTYWSKECLRIWGFDPESGPPTREAVLERIHPKDRDRVGEYSRKIIQSDKRTNKEFSQEFRIVLPDGTVKHIRSASYTLLSTDGTPVEVLGIHVDISEHKRAEQERERLHHLEAALAHINRVSMLGEMAASLAHEIKQPIAAAITSANTCMEWLAHDPPNLDRARAAAARIDKYGNRAAQIIDHIRSLYKKAPSQREWVDVNGVVQEIFTLLQDEAIRYSIIMHPDLAAELPKIDADRVQLQQVLMNLMINAVESMQDKGGELTVKSQLQDSQLLLSVSDTGTGLPKENIEQIFSAFFTTKLQGSGMGLAISRSIVEAHGGRLWATANDERGATFHFTLPVQMPDSSA